LLTAFLSILRDWIPLDPEFFRESDFRFVVNFLKATEAGKGKPVDGDRADFSDGRVFHRRTTAFPMNQDKHVALLFAARTGGRDGRGFEVRSSRFWNFEPRTSNFGLLFPANLAFLA
jgi:hypothetical protein